MRMCIIGLRGVVIGGMGGCMHAMRGGEGGWGGEV